MPREIKRIDATCLRCGAAFITYPSRIASGAGKYCSRACSLAAREGQPRQLKPRQAPAERPCIVCGKPFMVGGRGNANWNQLACSMECQQTGRIRRGTAANTLSAIDAAYLAGFIDGEGSFIIYRRDTTITVRLLAYNTDKPVLEWVKDVTGVGGVFLARQADERHDISYHWHVNGEGAVTVARQIRPYLRVKAPQADLAIECYERLRVPALKADRSWQLEWRARMQALNKRGPRAEPD